MQYHTGYNTGMVNLLSYTKKLSEKIRFYDKIAPKEVKNPFAKPVNITVIWVEDKK